MIPQNSDTSRSIGRIPARDNKNSNPLVKVTPDGKIPPYIKKKRGSIKTVAMSDVVPEEVEFLWEPYIPRGKITLLEGDPSAGKTFLALTLAAAISTGNPLPDPKFGGKLSTRRDPENVIFMSAEDGVADTLVPRLIIISADLTKIHALQGITRGTKEDVFTFDDIEHLDCLMDDKKPALVVVDPLQAYLGAGVDMHRANQTRPVMAKLGMLAEKHRCAMLILRHLNKAIATKGIYRGMGSIDITGAARSVLLSGCDPRDKENRALVHIKSNLAPHGPSIGYSINRVKGLVWTGISPIGEADLLGSDLIPPKKEQAKHWLISVLSAGPKTAKEIGKLAVENGINARTLQRAKKDLGVISSRLDSSPTSPWIWKLP